MLVIGRVKIFNGMSNSILFLCWGRDQDNRGQESGTQCRTTQLPPETGGLDMVFEPLGDGLLILFCQTLQLYRTTTCMLLILAAGIAVAAYALVVEIVAIWERSQHVAKMEHRQAERCRLFSRTIRYFANKVINDVSSPKMVKENNPSPIGGFYVDSGRNTDYEARAGTGTCDSALQLHFEPYISGWQIRGTRMKPCGEPFRMVYGHVSSSWQVFWAEQTPEGIDTHLFVGSYNQQKGFLGEWHCWSGILTHSLHMLPITESCCRTHFSISCNACNTRPLQGTRYSAPGFNYDLCEMCMSQFGSIVVGNDPPPVKKTDMKPIERPLMQQSIWQV